MFENPSRQPISTQDRALKKATTVMTGQQVFEAFLNKSRKLKEQEFIGLEGFGDIYSSEKIKEDRRRVEYVKNSSDFEKPTNYSIVCENMLAHVMQESGWFSIDGVETNIIQTAEFDDVLVNGAHADAVVEIRNKNGDIVNFGLDFTTSAHPDRLNKKRDRYYSAVKRGKLFDIKYFKSDADGYRGLLRDIPVFAVGLSKDTVAGLCESYGKSNDLARHYTLHMVFDEILHQIDEFVARSVVHHGAENPLTEKLEVYREIILQIAEKKNSLRPKDFDAKAGGDEVYNFIKKFF